MPFPGTRFPEGIDPNKYTEVESLNDIECHNLRETILTALNTKDRSSLPCFACQESEAVIVDVNLDFQERIFVRKDSACIEKKARL